MRKSAFGRVKARRIRFQDPMVSGMIKTGRRRAKEWPFSRREAFLKKTRRAVEASPPSSPPEASSFTIRSALLSWCPLAILPASRRFFQGAGLRAHRGGRLLPRERVRSVPRPRLRRKDQRLGHHPVSHRGNLDSRLPACDWCEDRQAR